MSVLKFEEQAATPSNPSSGQWSVYTKSDGLYYLEDDGTEVGPLSTTGELSQGYIDGLIMSNDTDTDHDIEISVGECRDSTDSEDLALSAVMTKQIDASWAVGDDAGGLFSGSVAADTWYHVFVIMKDSDSSIDAGFDTDVDAANIPAGYTEYRRIGSVLTDASSNILAFVQTSDYVFWVDPPRDVNDSTLGTTAKTYTLSTPPDVQCIANLRTGGRHATQQPTLLISYLSQTDTAPSVDSQNGSNFRVSIVNFGLPGPAQWIMTNTSSQVRARSDQASTTLYLFTVGYIDFRGQQ